MPRNFTHKVKLYDENGEPCKEFNKQILNWLSSSTQVIEGHKPPATFEPLRKNYDNVLNTFLTMLVGDNETTRWAEHKRALSNLTNIMFGIDLSKKLSSKYSSDTINENGFRSNLSNSMAKNTGENFTNAIVYALADALSGQDEILVDKGLPPKLREPLTLKKTFIASNNKSRDLRIPIEVDLTIFSRSNPLNAITLSSKTRLKEVFHIGTMWKLLFDIIDDSYCLDKWKLAKADENSSTKNILYVFATADMISKKGKETQGPDIERDEVRNLIATDASFFDYVFVSKSNIPHVSSSLNIKKGRESLFHELGCLLDLIQQKFGLKIT